MREVIEKLLILQDRDRQIMRLKDQLARVEPEREMLQAKSSGTLASHEAAKLRVKQIETERKDLELQVQAKKTQIEKYGLQQFQTKKNEEYRALAKEMDNCKEAIVKIEDQEIELMEKAEAAAKEAAAASQEAAEAKKVVDSQLKDLATREANLKTELTQLESNRDQLTTGVDDSTMGRYTRLLKNKGENVLVGIQHGVCGGCHMKFPQQIVVGCQSGKELVTCPNCGRILYYTKDMDLSVTD